MLGPAGPSHPTEPIGRSTGPWGRRWATITIAILIGLIGTPAFAADEQDLGDAPAGYDLADAGPARAGWAGPRLGSAVTADTIDPETGVSANASDTAAGDRGDDALDAAGSVRTGRLLTVSRQLAISRVTEPTRVCGWIDFDQTGNFSDDERVCAEVAAGDITTTLRWSGRPADVGRSYLRLRIGTTAADVEEPVGPSADGEVEDYPLEFISSPVEPEPEVTLTVAATPGTVRAVGDLITYTLTATNTGETRLTELTVSDELPGLSPLDCGDTTTLAIDDSLTCTATRATTQDDLDLGSIFNLAQVSGEAPGGDPADPSDDVVAVADAVVGVAVRPALQLSVEADPTAGSAGDVVTWTYRAANVGNVTLDAVRISAGLDGVSTLSYQPQAGGSLAPGAAMVCTGTYQVTRADARRGSVTAAAAVRAEPPYGDPTVSDDNVTDRATATVTVRPSTTPSTPGGGTAANPSAGDGLADTGSSVALAPVGLVALLLIGSAALVLLLGRRRR